MEGHAQHLALLPSDRLAFVVAKSNVRLPVQLLPRCSAVTDLVSVDMYAGERRPRARGGCETGFSRAQELFAFEHGDQWQKAKACGG